MGPSTARTARTPAVATVLVETSAGAHAIVDRPLTTQPGQRMTAPSAPVPKETPGQIWLLGTRRLTGEQSAPWQAIAIGRLETVSALKATKASRASVHCAQTTATGVAVV